MTAYGMAVGESVPRYTGMYRERVVSSIDLVVLYGDRYLKNSLFLRTTHSFLEEFLS